MLPNLRFLLPCLILCVLPYLLFICLPVCPLYFLLHYRHFLFISSRWLCILFILYVSLPIFCGSGHIVWIFHKFWKYLSKFRKITLASEVRLQENKCKQLASKKCTYGLRWYLSGNKLYSNKSVTRRDDTTKHLSQSFINLDPSPNFLGHYVRNIVSSHQKTLTDEFPGQSPVSHLPPSPFPFLTPPPLII